MGAFIKTYEALVAADKMDEAVVFKLSYLHEIEAERAREIVPARLGLHAYVAARNGSNRWYFSKGN